MFNSISEKVIQKKEAKTVSYFSLLQFFFWSTWAIYGGYLVYYLTDLGYNNTQIGTIMAIRTFMSIIGPLFIGYLCDKIKNRKNIFMLGMFLLALLIVPFPLYNWNLILIVTALIGFIWSPQQSVLDSWILETSPDLAINYGFMRAWGSIGFAIFVTIYGLVIENLGWTFHFLSYGILCFITIIISYFIKDQSYFNSEDDKYKDHIKTNTDKIPPENKFYQLLINKQYIFILIISFLIFVPITIIFIFLAPIIQSVGGTAKHLGYTLFFNALSEAPIFFMGKKILKKYRIKFLLFLASLFYLIRIIIAALANIPVTFIFFGLLQSTSFGIYLISVRHYIKIIAPSELQTTAQSIVLTAAFGIGGITASLLGGFIIDNFGINIMFIFCITIISLVVILLFISVIMEKIKD